MNNKLMRRAHHLQINITTEVHSNSLEKDENIAPSAKLEQPDQKLMGKFEAAYRKQSF